LLGYQDIQITVYLSFLTVQPYFALDFFEIFTDESPNPDKLKSVEIFGISQPVFKI
jgi:hypothetical protein